MIKILQIPFKNTKAVTDIVFVYGFPNGDTYCYLFSIQKLNNRIYIIKDNQIVFSWNIKIR